LPVGRGLLYQFFHSDLGGDFAQVLDDIIFPLGVRHN